MHIAYEYKNNFFTSLFCHTFDNRDKHKLQRKNCGSYFLNITIRTVIAVLLFSSCINHNHEEIIQQARITPIHIPVSELICLQPRNKRLRQDTTGCQNYWYVVYYDSLTCSMCELQRMGIWNEIIEKTNKIGVKMNFLFIFAPGSKQKTNKFIKEYYLKKHNLTIFVDSAGIVLKQNPILGNRILYAFILDKNNNIVKIGDASRSKELEQKYYQYLYSIK